MPDTPPERAAAGPPGCGLLAHGTASSTTATSASLRAAVLAQLGPGTPATFLKHADEQTVVGLAAVLAAVRASGRSVADFRTWGIVAAPRAPGRAPTTIALERFAAEGAWSVTPHVVPHCSLHSLSGVISQALKVRGPNLGVGGTPHGEAEALLAVPALLAAPDCPGAWVVLAGWRPEPLPGVAAPVEEPVCRAVALALTARPVPGGSAVRVGWGGPLSVVRSPLSVATGRSSQRTTDYGQRTTEFSLESLFAALNGPAAASQTWAVPPLGTVELARPAAARRMAA